MEWIEFHENEKKKKKKKDWVYPTKVGICKEKEKKKCWKGKQKQKPSKQKDGLKKKWIEGQKSKMESFALQEMILDPITLKHIFRAYLSFLS